MVTVSLGEIASSIVTGYPFKSKVESDPEGTVRVIQLRNIEDGGELSIDEPIYVSSSSIQSRYLLNKNDIILRTRGTVNSINLGIRNAAPGAMGPKTFPAILCSKEVLPAVAASPIIVIRVNPKDINPAYLVWFLNHPNRQRELLKHSRGSNLQMVSKSALVKVGIALPSLETQQKIAEFSELQKQEQILLQRLEKNRQMYLDAILTGRVADS
jgi:restriction endonuclease S subunit